MTALLHDPEFFSGHDNPSHPENARRLSLMPKLSSEHVVPWRAATNMELLAIHTPEHLQRVASKCAEGGGMLDPDTYCGPKSECVARAAVGGLIDLSLGVESGVYRNGLALTRPPGHHATSDRTMGFCLYNPVAVATAALRSMGVPRVVIIDFDVHHGNGTQDIFYEDSTVMYLSSHQYPHFPGSGAASETGHGSGVGFTLNHPFPAGTEDEAFLSAYRDHLLPALVNFQPGFIMVSAGYDAHKADPLAGLNITTAGFESLTEMLAEVAVGLCGGKIVFSLEGGYNPPALTECVEATAKILNRTYPRP